MKNYLLKIEYDGSGFHGWQRQKGLRTVQGALEEAVSKVFGEEIELSGTSRTDAGVHALMQCASFKAESNIPTENISKAINNMLSGGRYGEGSKGSDVRILSAEEMPDDFHARFSCKGKRYHYLITQGSQSAFEKDYSYNVDSGALNIESMKAAAKHLIGIHDFASFQAAGGTPRETTVRTIFDANVTLLDAGGGMPGVSEQVNEQKENQSEKKRIMISVTGDGFLYNMVRIIAGTLVEVGLGKIEPDAVTEIIEAKDRTLAGHTAPPCGLYLAEIFFDEESLRLLEK